MISCTQRKIIHSLSCLFRKMGIISFRVNTIKLNENTVWNEFNRYAGISFIFFFCVFDDLFGFALRSKSRIRINAHWCWPCSFTFVFLNFSVALSLWVSIEYVRFFWLNFFFVILFFELNFMHIF